MNCVNCHRFTTLQAFTGVYSNVGSKHCGGSQCLLV